MQTEEKMKSCLKNLSRKSSKSSSSLPTASQEILHKEMTKEMTMYGVKQPNATKIQQLLNATRDVRQTEVTKMSAAQIFEAYPALRKQELVKNLSKCYV